METIIKNHQHSGHLSSGEEWLHEVNNSFLNAKGKNVDISYFYEFLMLEDKDLKFASRQLEDIAIGSAGLNSTNMFLFQIFFMIWRRRKKQKQN